jgi:hypothetical protein
MSAALPMPTLNRVYRLEATLGAPLDLGQTAQGHRRIVSLTGGTFTGPELNGQLLGGTSADRQILLADGTALGDIRYTLRTDDRELLYVQSSSIRHGSEDVLARADLSEISMMASSSGSSRSHSDSDGRSEESRLGRRH